MDTIGFPSQFKLKESFFPDVKVCFYEIGSKKLLHHTPAHKFIIAAVSPKLRDVLGEKVIDFKEEKCDPNAHILNLNIAKELLDDYKNIFKALYQPEVKVPYSTISIARQYFPGLLRRNHKSGSVDMV